MSTLPDSSKTNQTTPHSSVCDTVLSRLADEKVAPRPWWHFYVREYAVWCFWLLSVLVGAAAVAVTLYIILSVPFMLYEALYSNLAIAVVQVLPWLWLVVFLVMSYLAWVNLQQTSQGYRYQTVTLVASSVVFSLGLGFVLHQFGQGYVMDQTLATWMSTYPSHEKARLTVWQAPQEGRLVGTVLADQGQILIDHATGTLIFKDNAGDQWRLVVSELPEPVQIALQENPSDRFRLIGTTTAPHEFHVCGAFYWVFKPNYEDFKQMQITERGVFKQTALHHQQSVAAAMPTHCASLPAFQRMSVRP